MSYLDHAKMQYALDDISIIPAVTSDIKSRKECNPYMDDGMLPIFASPMATVVSPENYDEWVKNKITPILPRNVDIQTRLKFTSENKWCAYSLSEFKDHFIDYPSSSAAFEGTTYALIDIANGHMQIVIDYIKQAKKAFLESGHDFKVMVGNIANPATYQKLAEAGADYVRCGIGGGKMCSTSCHTAIHFGMASLLASCQDLKEHYDYDTVIIADGGIDSYGRAITALALGADYVMIGSAFAKCYESAAIKKLKYADHRYDGYELHDIYKDDYSHKSLIKELTGVKQGHMHIWFRNDGKLLLKNYFSNELILTPSEDQKKILLNYFKGQWYAEHFGMSTKTAQKLIDPNATKLKTSEGVTRTINIEYTIAGWTENFTDYLRSTMSYCGKRTLMGFVGNVEVGILSPSEQFAFNK